MRAIVAVLALASLITACSGGVRRETPADRPRAAVVPERAAPSPRADAGGAALQAVDQALTGSIRAHRELLAADLDARLRPMVMRRLGDLLVARSESSLQAIDGLAAAELPQSAEARAALDQRVAALYQQSENSLREAASVYTELVDTYPRFAGSAEALYQLARVEDALGRAEAAQQALARLASEHPAFGRVDEVHFRRGEMLFQAERYAESGVAYHAALSSAPRGPFADQALYKRGWAEFKDKRYDAALDSFFALLDRYLSGRGRGTDAIAGLGGGLREQLEDTLRAVYLSFSNQDGPASAEAYLARSGGREYEDLVYRRLGEDYLRQERYTDAALSFLAYARRHPLSDDAPRFELAAIGAYEAGGFAQRVQEGKEGFAGRYAPDQPYWKGRDRQAMGDVLAELRTVWAELATYYHARGQQQRRGADFDRAESWYRAYLADPGPAREAAGVSFRFAELLSERGRAREAVSVYEAAAYDFGPHAKAADAGYAALLAYEAFEGGVPEAEKSDWQRATLASAGRFAASFPRHPQLAAVRARAAQVRLRLQDLAGAEQEALAVTALQPPPTQRLRQIAWSVAGHAAFEQTAYERAERAFVEALDLTAENQAGRAELRERLAASVYQQGESARRAGDNLVAARHFARVATLVPEASIRANAEFDAATAFVALEMWSEAIALLQHFTSRYPNHALAGEVPIKLALAYESSGQPRAAAASYESIGRSPGEPQLRRQALQSAAKLFAEAGDGVGESRALAYLVAQFPAPLEAAQEARWRLAELADGRAAERWLRELVQAHGAARARGTPRARYLAASASLRLVQDRLKAYRELRLRAPLEANLKRKRQLMESVLKSLGEAAEFGVAEVTTRATFEIAEVYRLFGRALLESERPRDLSELELEQYNLLLDEQAFPFEEKAIELHQLNLGRVTGGLYDTWVEQSLGRLADLVPVRYARPERDAEFLRALD